MINGIILDIETTGFDPKSDRIIEIAALNIKTKEIFHSLINPGIPIPSHIVELTNITSSMVREAPSFFEIKLDLLKFMHDKCIVGYNVSFDKRFLIKEDNKFSYYIYKDYLKYVKGLDYELPDYQLYTVAKFFGLKVTKEHRAINDIDLIFKLIKMLGFDYD